jgi:hypothetical protein
MKWAEVGAVENAAKDWSPQEVECRIYGHNWVPMTVSSHRRFYIIRQQCNRGCGCERQCDMDMRGRASRWAMSYPDGYLLSRQGRIGQDGRAWLRLESLNYVTVTEVDE